MPNVQQCLEWWKSRSIEVNQKDSYISPYKVGTDKWKQDMAKHSQKNSVANFTGKLIKTRGSI